MHPVLLQIQFALYLLAATHAIQGEPTVTRIEDIPYGDTGHERCQMDLYLPPADSANGAAVLFVHGGGWHQGHRGQWRGLAEKLAANGYVCASIGYRLLPDHTFPVQIEDVRAAMAAFKDRADEYGFDPERIGVVGSSAGGQLAALLATIAEDDELGVSSGLSRRDTRPAAAALYNPVVDFTHDEERMRRSIPLFGGTIDENRPLYEAASPALRIDDHTPPMLFLYGTKDALTPVSTVFPMAHRLYEYRIPCEIALFIGQEHGFGYGLRHPEQQRAAEKVCVFFNRHLVRETGKTVQQ